MNGYLFLFLTLFVASACTGQRGGISTPADAEGFSGRKLSLAEVIATYPKLNSLTELYCRNVDPNLEAPLGALNPSIPLIGSPSLELWVKKDQNGALLPPIVKIGGVEQTAYVQQLQRILSPEMQLLTYTQIGELIVSLNTATLVSGNFLFGSFYGFNIERNVLCTVDPGVFSQQVGSGASVTPDEEVHFSSNSFLAPVTDWAPSASTMPEQLVGEWKSDCLDLGNAFFQYSVRFDESGFLDILVRNWLASNRESRCDVLPAQEQKIVGDQINLKNSAVDAYHGSMRIMRDEVRTISSYYNTFLNLMLIRGEVAPWERGVWRSSKEVAKITPLQFAFSPGSTSQLHFYNVSPDLISIYSTLPDPSSGNYTRQGEIRLKKQTGTY